MSSSRASRAWRIASSAVEAAGRVGQDRVALQVEIIEDVAALFVDQPFAADGHRRHLAAAGGKAVAHQLVAGVLAGAGDEPAAEAKLADRPAACRPAERLRSTAADERDDLDRVAWLQGVRQHVGRGTTSPLTSTATRRRS